MKGWRRDYITTFAAHIDPVQNPGAEEGCFSAVTAIIQVTERTCHFDPSEAGSMNLLEDARIAVCLDCIVNFRMMFLSVKVNCIQCLAQQFHVVVVERRFVLHQLV